MDLHWKGKSSTVRIAPIYNWMNEYHLREFVKDIAEPIGYIFHRPDQPFCKIKSNALHYALVAYVTFESPEHAIQAVIKLNQTLIHGLMKPYVNHASSAIFTSIELKGKTTWIKMSNIDHTVDEQQILDWMKKEAGIDKPPVSINLFHHKRNKELFAGFAHIQLSSNEVLFLETFLKSL